MLLLVGTGCTSTADAQLVVVTKFIQASVAGDCATTRQYTTAHFKAVYGDSICKSLDGDAIHSISSIPEDEHFQVGAETGNGIGEKATTYSMVQSSTGDWQIELVGSTT